MNNTSFENEAVLTAYQNFAQTLLDFVGKNSWDEAVAKYEIFSNMVSSEFCWKKNEKSTYKGISNINNEVLDKSNDSVRFLRKHFLDLTGDRIWGLTFTLYPTGKFNIQYDYNEPEGYEEADELITGEEINKSFMQN